MTIYSLSADSFVLKQQMSHNNGHVFFSYPNIKKKKSKKRILKIISEGKEKEHFWEIFVFEDVEYCI